MNKRERLNLMGQVVTVTKTLERSVIKNSVLWVEKKIEPRAGWVVGFRNVYNGTIVHSGGYDPDTGFDNYEQGYLDNARSVPHIQVTFWPNHNPVKVPYDGYALGGEAPKKEKEKLWPKGYEEDIKRYERDERGRWTGGFIVEDV